MSQAQLHIDLSAIQANWRALDAASAAHVETAATIKANAYGLGADRVGRALAQAGARRFFVAIAEEGAALRKALGPDLPIHVYGGHMAGDAPLIAEAGLIPMLNSSAQVHRHMTALPDHPYGVQLDSGMNRLGMEADDWSALSAQLLAGPCQLVMSHLACADDPDHAMNALQLAEFRRMTDGIPVPRSISATGGVLLGAEYHFDLTRPGIGLYGGQPFAAARPVVRLAIPVIQTRKVTRGETVGYGNSFTAPCDMRLATIAAGYADGIHRALSGKATLWHDGVPCPLVGRVSMDLLTIDVSALSNDPEALDLLCPQQGVDDLADIIGTIGYEMLTSLGQRYARIYT